VPRAHILRNWPGCVRLSCFNTISVHILFYVLVAEGDMNRTGCHPAIDAFGPKPGQQVLTGACELGGVHGQLGTTQALHIYWQSLPHCVTWWA